MRINNQILGNLRENKEDWYYLCNDAEQALFKVKNECKDERAIKSIERMILELNSIRMEQYEALTEYALVEDSDKLNLNNIIKAIENNYIKDEEEYYKKYNMDDREAHPPYWNFETKGDNGIVVDISWGDWKHDHNYCSSLVKRTAEELGLDCVEDESEVYEDDGSDTYSARHFFYFEPYDLNESSERADDELETPKVTVSIYQIKDVANTDYAFRGYDEVADKIDLADYDKVATIELPDNDDILETVFMYGNTDKSKFNEIKPMRSISVSDIIDYDDTMYYVDSFGFKEL